MSSFSVLKQNVLIHEVYLILLFINLQRFSTTLKTRRHAVSMTPKNWEFGECSEPRKFSVFGRRIDLKLKKPKGSFPGGEYGEISRNFNNQWNNEPNSFAITIFYYYGSKDLNTEEKRCLIIQLLQMKAIKSILIH